MRNFVISTGPSRSSRKFHNQEVSWEQLCTRLSTSVGTKETHAEYMRFSKDDQDNIKDIGGFIGGRLKTGQRLKANVLSRSLITFDIDDASPEDIDEFFIDNPYAVIIYSTHKHTKEQPRLRLIFPLTRDVTPEEYEAVCRKLAQQLDILQLLDPTTYDLNRLMYWPSHSSDIEPFYFADGDSEVVDPDKILSLYPAGWQNMEDWPLSDKEQALHRPSGKKAEDPYEKRGYIGAFCRTYTIQEAIDKYLPDVYTQVSDNRYTYTGGSTTGGAVVYADKWIYSNHATDPISQRLCNAYDMVRIHLYGSDDSMDNSGNVTSEKRSMARMDELCSKDKAVVQTINEERYKAATSDFSGDSSEDTGSDDAQSDTNTAEAVNNLDWMADLTMGNKGEILPTINNFYLIMQHDPHLTNLGGLNQLSQMCVVSGPLPWDTNRKADTPWNDGDDSGLRAYIERTYGINSRQNCLDALNLVQNDHKFHPIRKYLNSLKWDGTPRVDTLLIDYLGAEDTPYVRAVTRKALTAAVSRVFRPGCKYDNMLTLVGPQGIGKSTLLSRLGGPWFTDTISDISGKDGYEALQGQWIIEMSELTATRKADVEAVKQFISKTTDKYRRAYARNPGEYPRQCIFIGTTNDKEVLRDYTGNRRYWLVDVGKHKSRKDVFALDQSTVDQIWAEAKARFESGESLYLDRNMTAEATKVQEAHQESDIRVGMILNYLDTKLPENWSRRDVKARQEYFSGDDFGNQDRSGANAGTVERTRVCAAEILYELFGLDKSHVKRSDSREINQIMDTLPGWKRADHVLRFGMYGVQRGFVRVGSEDDDDRWNSNDLDDDF